MTHQIYDWVKSMKKHIGVPKEVLEIGSLNFNGGVRELFEFCPETNYLGTDMQAGKGVDKVINAHSLLNSENNHTYDLIICLETLEHDDKPWETLDNINYLLKTNGYFLVSAPTLGFPYHAYPKDYWRFTRDSFEDIILKNFEIIDLVELKDDAGYPTLCALGKKK